MILLLPAATAFSSDNWQYVQDIGVPSSMDEPAKVTLDPTLLAHAQLSGADLRVAENGVEVAYKLSLEGTAAGWGTVDEPLIL